MKIAFHGGKCCAIKHIHELGAAPSALLDALNSPKPGNEAKSNPDQSGLDVSSQQNFFYGKAPEETYLKRFDRYVKYLDKVRPHGIIEVVLCDYASYGVGNSVNQLLKWEPVLLERGFILVTSCLNSNSQNRVFVYHRKTDVS